MFRESMGLLSYVGGNVEVLHLAPSCRGDDFRRNGRYCRGGYWATRLDVPPWVVARAGPMDCCYFSILADALPPGCFRPEAERDARRFPSLGTSIKIAAGMGMHVYPVR